MDAKTRRVMKSKQGKITPGTETATSGSAYEGEVRIKEIASGPVLFARLKGKWIEAPLFKAGEGIFSGNTGLEVKHKTKSVANFGDTIRLGRKQNDTGRLELDVSGNVNFINRQGSTDNTVLKISTAGTISAEQIDGTKTLEITSGGDITTKGIILVETAGAGGNVGIRMANDGGGYNQFMFGGANAEIRMGYSGSGGSLGDDSSGSSKIFMNMGAGTGHTGIITWARQGTDIFSMGNTYEVSYDELRMTAGQDTRVLADAGITLNTNGNVSISPIAGSGFHRVSVDQIIRFAHTVDNSVIVQLLHSDGTVVKIPAGAIITTVAAVVHTVSNLSTHNVNIQLSDTNGTAADSSISSGTEILGAGVANTDSTDSASTSDIDLKNDPKEVWICRDTVTRTGDSYVYICNANDVSDNGDTNSTSGTLSVVIDYYGMD